MTIQYAAAADKARKQAHDSRVRPVTTDGTDHLDVKVHWQNRLMICAKHTLDLQPDEYSKRHLTSELIAGPLFKDLERVIAASPELTPPKFLTSEQVRKSLEVVSQAAAERYVEKRDQARRNPFEPNPPTNRRPKNTAMTPPRNDRDGDEESRIEIPHRAPHELARAVRRSLFNRDGHCTMYVFQGRPYLHDGSSYVELDIAQLKAKTDRFIDQKVRLKDDNHKDVAPTSWHVRETISALTSHLTLPRGTSPPCWLDESEPPPWGKATRVLAVQNGIFDPVAGQLFPADPRWFNLGGVSVRYNPEATCPNLHALLTEWWGDDQESKDCLAEFIAATIMGETDYHKILAIKGPPRSGKGVLFAIVSALLGPSGAARIGISDLQSNFGLEGIIGRSAVFVADARLGANTDTAIAIERLLKISGGDSPSIPRKFLPNYEGPLRSMFWLSFNILPALRDGDGSGALPNRFQFLRLSRSFLGKEDPTLFERRIKPELEGILIFALEGWRRLQKRGHFFTPESAEGLAEQNVELNSALSDFLRDCCVLHPDAVSDKDSTAAGHDPIFEAYVAWGEKKKLRHSMSRDKFFQQLESVTGIDTNFRRDSGTGLSRDRQCRKTRRRILGIYVRDSTPVRWDGTPIEVASS